MTDDLPDGVYERVVTRALGYVLSQMHAHAGAALREPLDPAEAPVTLARHVYEALLRNLRELTGDDRLERQVEVCNHLMAILKAERDVVVSPAEALLALVRFADGAPLPGVLPFPPRPHIPLSANDLLVNARGQPGAGHVLAQEIPSSDRIDLLCAFVKWNGFRVLEAPLRAIVWRLKQPMPADLFRAWRVAS